MDKQFIDNLLFQSKAIQVGRQIRKTDPDVYLSAESARVRSRQLGCIGIRRYPTVDGGEAWMPCTNESDYRRRMGIGQQARRDKEKKEREFVKRVVNDKKNTQSNKYNFKSLNSKLKPDNDNRFIVSKVRNHNNEMKLAGKGDQFMATIGTLEKIWNKEIKNGSKSAMRRINAFLSVLSGAQPNNLKYIADLSLLPDKHPRKTSIATKRYLLL